MLESEIQKACLDYLRLLNIPRRKINTVGIKKADGSWIPSQSRGTADIIGVLRSGRFLAVEVKRPGGKLSKEQVEFLEEFDRGGAVCMVVTSVEELEKFIKPYL